MKVCFLTQHALRPASQTGLSRQTPHELAFTIKDENLFPLAPTPDARRPYFQVRGGCGHAPVGGDGGDEEDGGDEGENISQSFPPSSPSPPSLFAKRPTTYDHTR